MLQKIRCLNSNAIKFIAAFTMLVDHVGYMFFDELVWRIIGRIAMPLFAFAIAEGCHYTKNKLKHFLMLFGLAVMCQAVYFIFDPGATLYSILFTFSFATLIIYAMQYFKKSCFAKDGIHIAISFVLFAASICFTYWFCKSNEVDYGFWGCMMPVFAALPDFRKIENIPNWLKKVQTLPVRVLVFGVGLLLMILSHERNAFYPVMWYHLIGLALLFLYNGNKGKLRTKYFFYVFYPAHLAILEGIWQLLYVL